MKQCVDNKLFPAISLILVTKPEFIPVRQAAPSVQTPMQFFHSRPFSSTKPFKSLKISLLVVCVGNSETLKMSSFTSLSSWSIYRTYSLTYLLTPCNTVFLEKLTGSAASQEIPRIFGTRRFITVLTSARHLSLS